MKNFTFGISSFNSMDYYVLTDFLARSGLNPMKECHFLELPDYMMQCNLQRELIDACFTPHPYSEIIVQQKIGFIFTISEKVMPHHPCCCLVTTSKFLKASKPTVQKLLGCIQEI